MKFATSIISSMVLGLFLPTGSGAAGGAETTKVSMTAEHWKTEGIVEFGQHKGVASVELKRGDYAAHVPTGQAVLNDLTFRDGTIEFDVDPTGAMGAGIGFRRRDKDTYEDFYLRPRPKCSEAPDCMQYAPVTHGILLWDLFPQYQAPAPLRDGEWNHIKLVVSGQRMNVFINGAKSPSLKIGRLEGDATEGGLLLQGPGFFANLTVTPNAVEGLAAESEKDSTSEDSRYVRNWQLAPFHALPQDKEIGIADLPSASTGWQSVAAERNGLVNVSRQYGLPLQRPDRAVTWLKTTIRSDKNQMKKASIGWSREVWVFVNGHLMYADKNFYGSSPSSMKTPEGRCSMENGTMLLPLNQGENEIAVALANNFYGWALILHLDDADGVHFGDK